MNEDFVRQLPDTGFVFRPTSQLGLRIHVDFSMLILILAISTYGLLILFSASGRDVEAVTSQIIKLGVAVVVMLCMAQISPFVYLRIAFVLFVLVVLLLLLTHFFGTEVKGSQRWLRIPGVFGFQPSELMKLVLPMTLAWYFHHRQLPPRLRHIFWALVLIMLPAGLVLLQPDLGTALLIIASGLLVLLLAGVSWGYVALATGLALLCAPAVWFMLLGYQQQRILTFLNPEQDPLGAGWNIIQSKTAMGSGGLSGKGLFQGTQSHLDFLPESKTDFIIAVLGEEFGLIGVVMLLIMYILLIVRGCIIAVKAPDSFGRLLAGSITLTFFVYVFVNIGMVTGLLPVVGVPLPLVSFGGTSIVTLFAGFGIVMSIHTHRWNDS